MKFVTPQKRVVRSNPYKESAAAITESTEPFDGRFNVKSFGGFPCSESLTNLVKL